MKSIEGNRKRRAPPSDKITKLSKDSRNEDKPFNHRDERLREILNILPPEIWDTIFEKVHSPNDKLTLMNTCRAWYSLLASQRVTNLLPLVLPLIAPYLEVKDFFILRLVNKQWRHLIDNPVQTYSTTAACFETHWWHIDSPYAKLLNRLKTCYRLLSPSELVSLSNHLSGYSTFWNPFISRHVTLDIAANDEFQLSQSTAVNFLKSWGRHLHSLHHFCADLNENEVNCVSTLPSILTLTPNIRSLKIEWFSDDQIYNASPLVRQLLDTPQQYPSLPYLTHLDFRGGDSQEMLLDQVLLRTYGNTLTSLTLRGNSLDGYDEELSLSSHHLPNLVNFRLCFVTSRALRNLSSSSLPLQRLVLWYSFQSIDIDCLLSSVARFMRSLTHLHLDVKIHCPLADGQIPGNLLFSQLTHLSCPLSSVNSWWLIQFLQVCPNLTHLTLQTAMESVFAPFERKHLQKEISLSNDLFSVCPRLKQIRFWFHNDGYLTLNRENYSSIK